MSKHIIRQRDIVKPFLRQISKSAANELVVAYTSLDFRKLLLHGIHTDTAKGIQIKRIVRDLGIAILIVAIPVDTGGSLDLREKVMRRTAAGFLPWISAHSSTVTILPMESSPFCVLIHWQWLLFYLLSPVEDAGYAGLMLKILSSP